MDVDELSYKQAVKQLRKYRTLWVLDIFLLAVCIGCLTASLIIRSRTYDEAISISPATDTAVKQAAYLNAVAINPRRPEAYILLLESYGEDGYFTKSESDTFLRLYNSNHAKMSPQNEYYAKLHYTAGLMYINSYEADTSTRIRKAIPFLNEAKKNMTEEHPLWLPVIYYCEIGDFCQNYLWNTSAIIREIDPIKMEELVAEIGQMLTSLAEQENPDLISVRLGFCIFVSDLLYVQRDTLAATVEEHTVMQLFEHIYDGLPDVESLQNEQTRNLRKILDQDRMFYLNALNAAYRGEKST